VLNRDFTPGPAVDGAKGIESRSLMSPSRNAPPNRETRQQPCGFGTTRLFCNGGQSLVEKRPFDFVRHAMA